MEYSCHSYNHKFLVSFVIEHLFTSLLDQEEFLFTVPGRRH